jgi:hypothetical protein
MRIAKYLKLSVQANISWRMTMRESGFQKRDATPSQPWVWPENLDALIAAPRHHRLVYENERVRVLEVRIGSGELVPLHTHRWPSLLHVQSWSEHVRRDEAGTVTFDSRRAGIPAKAPFTAWCEPLPPHSVENVGTGELLVLSIEVKEDAPEPKRS